MQRNKNLWKKDYFTILIGQGFSLISSGILQMSIIFYLTAETGSAMVLSIATLIGFLPQALIGPFAGVFVDRHSRKKVMIGADLVIAAAGGGISNCYPLYGLTNLGNHGGFICPKYGNSVSLAGIECSYTTTRARRSTDKVCGI